MEHEYEPLAFTKSWLSAEDFPTHEYSEELVREDMQRLHDEVKNYLNGIFIDWLTERFGGVDDAIGDLDEAVESLGTDSHTHSNKLLLDTYNQSNANLSDAVTKRHAHSNKVALDTVPSGGVVNTLSDSAASVPTCHAVNAALVDAGALPTGGSTGYVLKKRSSTDYDTAWGSPTLAVPVGTILPFGGTTVPTGYLLCDGAAVSRTTYADLFAVIGTTYGAGNGSTTFNVPNLTGRFPLGKNASHALGSTGGAERHTLTVSEMPNHTHSETAPGNYGGFESGGANAIRGGVGSTTGATGGGAAHNNMPPYLAVNYIIKAVSG